jgi:hypothetical protein
MVDEFIGSLKLAETTWFTGTPVAPAAGIVEVTEGTMVTAVSFPHPPKNIIERAARKAAIPNLQVRIENLMMGPHGATFNPRARFTQTRR